MAYRRSYWNQPTWCLASTGTASNSGLNAANPITAAEFARRWGVGERAIIDVPVSIRCIDTLGANDSLQIRAACALGGSITLEGPSTVVVSRSGTVSSSTALNSATQTPLSITEGTTDWTADVNKQIYIPTGARAGAHSWVAKAVSSGVARLSPAMVAQANINSSNLFVTPAAADQYQIRSLPTVNVGFIDVDAYGPSQAAVNSRVFVARDLSLNFNNVGYIAGDCGVFSGLAFNRCILQTPASVAVQTYANGCILQGFYVYQGSARVDGCLSNTRTIISTYGAVVIIDGNTMSQGKQLLQVTTNGMAELGTCCSFDCVGSGRSNAGMEVMDGGIVRMSDDGSFYGSSLYWGTNNAGYAEYVQAGGQILYDNPPTCNSGLGAGREAKVGGIDVLHSELPAEDFDSGARIVAHGSNT